MKVFPSLNTSLLSERDELFQCEYHTLQSYILASHIAITSDDSITYMANHDPREHLQTLLHLLYTPLLLLLSLRIRTTVD